MLISELMSIVDHYIEGAISLEQLEDWLAPRLPFIFRFPHSTAADLASEIELGLAEMHNGTRNEQEFRNSLKDFLRQGQIITRAYPEGQLTTTGSSNQFAATPIYKHSEFVVSPAFS